MNPHGDKPRVRRAPCGWWYVTLHNDARMGRDHFEFRTFPEALTFALTGRMSLGDVRLADCVSPWRDR